MKASVQSRNMVNGVPSGEMGPRMPWMKGNFVWFLKKKCDRAKKERGGVGLSGLSIWWDRLCARVSTHQLEGLRS